MVSVFIIFLTEFTHGKIGCSVATTGTAPSVMDLFFSFVIVEPFIRGNFELAFICIYNKIKSFFAIRSAGPLLPRDNFTSHPLERR